MWLVRMQIKQTFFLCATVFLFAGQVYADDFNPAGVIVENLPELSLNTMGTQPTSNPALWSGTPVSTLLPIIEQIGKQNLSPAERQLIVRLLTLDIAGGGFNDSNRILGESVFLQERLRALFHLGEWEEVLKLLALVPDNDLTDEMRQIKIDTLLMKGDVKSACGMLAILGSNTYSDKMNISCFLAREEKEKAVLSYDIYQENTSETDTVFALLAENGLREIPTDLPTDALLETTDVYLFSLTKNIAIDWSKQNRAVQITLADLPTTDIPLRIALGEKNGLSLEAMKKLYRMPLFEPDLNNSVINRASLHQRILNTSDTHQKVALLKEFTASVRKDKLFVNLAPVIADIFNTIKADENKVDLAFDAVQAYALTDNLAMAEPWFELLQDADLPIYKKQAFLLIPLWQIMGGGYPYDLAEQMNKYCGAKPIDACSGMKLFIDPKVYMAENTKEVADISDENIKMPKVDETKRTTRLGESLLQAILDIRNGQNLRQSYQFIREVSNQKVGDAILKEGMIFE